MVSNLIRFPMTFLAGAFIPFESMPPALLALARVMPLTYSVEALRVAISDPGNMATYLTDILALTLFSAALLVVAAEVLRRRLA
jgi:ABC-2 type transport system permease protein